MAALALSILLHALFALALYTCTPANPRPADSIAVGLVKQAGAPAPATTAAPGLSAAPPAAAPRGDGRDAAKAADTLASGAEARAAALALYIREVHGRLGALKRYPPAARSLGQQGVVEVSFSIDGEGRAHDETVTHSSGSGILDQSALELVRKASPFPAPPPALASAPLPLTVPIDFKLQR